MMGVITNPLVVSLAAIFLILYIIIGSVKPEENPLTAWYIVHKENGVGEEWWEIQYRYLLFRHKYYIDYGSHREHILYHTYTEAKGYLNKLFQSSLQDKEITIGVIREK